MSILTVALPDDLQQGLEALSRARQKPSEELVRESIRQFLAAQELQAMRNKLRPYAEAQGFLTDEDVFKVVS